MRDVQEIDFAALGPLEVRQGDRLVRLSGKQRALLSALLLDVNATVSRDRIVDALWDEPPRSAIANVQTHVSALRRVLATSSPRARVRLETRANGYSLTVDRDRLDLLVFSDMAERGRNQAKRGDLSAAEQELGRAVALWRGRPLSDVPLSDAVAPRLAEIEERFDQTWSAWVDARLSLGDHERLIGELRVAAAARPLRESIWERLIVALHRARRRGEALDTYQQARTILVDELGIEPGPPLRRLHTAILTDDPSLERSQADRATPVGEIQPKRPGTAADRAPGPSRQDERRLPGVSARAEGEPEEDSGRGVGRGPVVPAELPHDIRGFAGRSGERALLNTSLPATEGSPVSKGPGIWVISGTAGVGKTALAVHWTHAVADAFPDGQLHVNLCGFHPQRDPVEPAAALSQMLVSLGVDPVHVPEGLDEREKLFRSIVRGKRLALLLDDARTADQVRPLLPGHGDAVVLITSRLRLSDLIARDGAGFVPLAPLSPEDTCELLSHALGAERLAAEPVATEELARLCGRLPLALRIATANITDGSAVTIAGLVADLRDGDRLTRLAVDGTAEGAVEAAFRLSYQALPPEQQRMFRLLSLIPGPTFTPRTVVALLGGSFAAATKGLEALAAAHLVEQQGNHRYHLHDLLRAYAADRAECTETPQDRQQALSALLDYYVLGADAAGTTINSNSFPLPGEPSAQAARAAADLTDTGAALEWLQAEVENIIPAVVDCLTNGRAPFAWRIMNALRPFLSTGIYREEWLELGRNGLEAAEQLGDRQAQAAMHMSLGVAGLVLGRQRLAERHLGQALAASTECGWRAGIAEATTHLSSAHQRTGRLDEAVALSRRAIDLNQELDRPDMQAVSNVILGSARRWIGELTPARRHQERAYALYRATSGVYGQAICLTELAATLHDLGDLSGAIRRYAEALAICERIGARTRQVQALAGISRVHGETGDHAEALRNAELAVALAEPARNRRVQTAALDAMAHACFAAGRHRDGHEYQHKALDIAQNIGVAWDMASVLIGMAEQPTGACDPDEPWSAGRRALAIAEEHRFQLLEGKAAEALARISPTGDGLPYLRTALNAYWKIEHEAGIDCIQRMSIPHLSEA